MFLGMNEDLQFGINEAGLMGIMGTNEFAVCLVLNAQMQEPYDPVTMDTRELTKLTGLSMGQVIRAIKNLEDKWGIVRDRPVDIGTVTFYFPKASQG